MVLLYLSITLILSFVLPAGATAWIPTPQSYKNGRTICEIERANPLELAKRVSVPVNYAHPTNKKLSIYYWLHKAFNPNLPTLIFINGGPGDTAHNTSFTLPNWNVVFFDQRGNSCSRPETFTDYLSPQFYSSENTARDIDEIRKDLGLSEISIYGVSYGTVPAYIYGSLFTEYTRAIVLEGVIFKAGRPLIESQRKQKILQTYFDQQTPETQSKILELSKHSPLWYSAVGNNVLYLDHPFKSFTHLIRFIIEQPKESALEFISKFLPHPPIYSEYGFDHVVMGMLGCQELGMNLSNMSSFLRFNDLRLEPVEDNHLREHYCTPLNLNKVTRPLYRATRYNNEVPITYFQGSFDGATTADAAFRHFYSSKSKSKELILIKGGGHLPVFASLGSGYEKGKAVELRQKVLEQALQGNPLPLSLLKELSKSTELKWKKITP